MEIENKDVVIFSDNTAAVASVTNFKAKDPLLRSVAREVVMLMAAADAQIRVVHKPGVPLLDTADALSRIDLGEPFKS